MSELTSDDDEETVNLAILILVVARFCSVLRELTSWFKDTCSLVNTGLTPLAFPFVRSDGD